MAAVLLLALLLQPDVRPDPFDVRVELQGLYDEDSQATLQSSTAADLDLIHEVLYMPDWVLVDAAGHAGTWTEVRPQAAQALIEQRLEWMDESIQTVRLESSDQATVSVSLTTVRRISDAEGRYGPAGGSHARTETTPFRDTWIHGTDGWKLKSRTQVGRPTVAMDKTDGSRERRVAGFSDGR